MALHPRYAPSELRESERVAAFGLASVERAMLGKIGASPIATDAFAVFPAPAAALAAADELRSAGYRVDVASAPHADGTWSITARRTLPNDALAFVALRRELEAIARAHGGEFDGWGGTAFGEPVDDDAAIAFARPRLERYAPLQYPFGWPRERHERFARIVAHRPEAELIEVSAEPAAVPSRPGEPRTWHWRAALRDGDGEFETGALVEARKVPEDAARLERSSPAYWLRDAEFIGKDVAPLFAMPAELRRPLYHFVLSLKSDGTEVVKYFGFERCDGVADARSWHPERFVRAAHAVGRWQGAASREPELLEHPVLLRRAARYVSALGESAQGESARSETSRAAAPSTRQALLALVEAREQETLCHHRLVPTALADDPQSPGVTIVRDFGAVGPGAFGADLARLLLQALADEIVAEADFDALEREALAAYVSGANAAGADIGIDSVRSAYAATAALLFAPGASGACGAERLAPRIAELEAEALA